MSNPYSEMKRDLEMEVLAGCLRRKDVVRAACAHLAEWRWTHGVHSLLWEIVHKAWAENKETVSAATIRPHLRARDGTEDPALIEAVRAIVAHKGESAKTAVVSLAKMSRIDHLRVSSSQILTSIEERADEQEALSMFETARQRLVSTISDGSDLIDYYETARERIQGYRQRPDLHVPRFELPLPLLNEATRGGLPVRGRVAMILADTNAGKSTFVAAAGESAHRRANTVVLHISTEELLEDVQARYDGANVGCDRGDLLDGQFSVEAEAAFLEHMTERALRGGKLFIKCLPMGSSIHAVRPYIQLVRSRYPTHDFLLIIDSPDYLNSGERNKELRHDISAVYQTMKGWATDPELNLSILITTQVSGQWEGVLPPVTGASEARDKARIVDFGIALLEQEVEDKDKDKPEKPYVVGVNKNRIGKIKNVAVYVVGNTGTCRYRQIGNSFTVKELRAKDELEKDKKRLRDRDLQRRH